MPSTEAVLSYLERCGLTDVRPPSSAADSPNIVAEALALSLPDAMSPKYVSSLYSYRVPRLSAEGTCSLPNDLDPEPFSLSSHLLSLPPSSPLLSSHPFTLRLRRLQHVVSRLQSVTQCDWVGAYQLLPASASSPPCLVKLAYVGEPSRALFPITPEFISISGNSRTAANGRASVIADVRRRAEGVAYYECSGKVLSECCLPIMDKEGRCVDIVDVESWKAGWASSEEVLWEVAMVCVALGESGLIGEAV
jgi:L-methionine (R)-S-oxide reductase